MWKFREFAGKAGSRVAARTVAGGARGLRVVALAAAGAAAAGPALADRHCFPVAERYYMARQAILNEGGDPALSLGRALDHLRDAVAEATICGCPEAGGLLESLAARADVLGAGPAADQLVLDADSAVNAAVEACL